MRLKGGCDGGCSTRKLLGRDVVERNMREKFS